MWSQGLTKHEIPHPRIHLLGLIFVEAYMMSVPRKHLYARRAGADDRCIALVKNVAAAVLRSRYHNVLPFEQTFHEGPRQPLLRPSELIEIEQLCVKHVLHKVLLKSLVRKVDAELLEGVLLEPLEAIDVQDAYLSTGRLPGGSWENFITFSQLNIRRSCTPPMISC